MGVCHRKYSYCTRLRAIGEQAKETHALLLSCLLLLDRPIALVFRRRIKDVEVLRAAWSDFEDRRSISAAVAILDLRVSTPDARRRRTFGALQTVDSRSSYMTE
jgi:hypothetical protein